MAKKPKWSYNPDRKALVRDDGMALIYSGITPMPDKAADAIQALRDWLNGGDAPSWIGHLRKKGPYEIEVPVWDTFYLKASAPQPKVKAKSKAKKEEQRVDMLIDRGLLVQRTLKMAAAAATT